MDDQEKCMSCKNDFPWSMMHQFDSEIDHDHARWVQLCPRCLDTICTMLGYDKPFAWDNTDKGQQTRNQHYQGIVK